jgi:hypothetical protein
MDTYKYRIFLMRRVIYRKTLCELEEKVDEIKSAIMTINATPNTTPSVEWPIPWDQKPIRLTDPTGRTFPLPLEACSTYDVSFSFHCLTHDKAVLKLFMRGV